MLLEIHRVPKTRDKNAITKAEFTITKLFMDMLGIEVDSDYSIYDGNSDDLIPTPFERGNKVIGYCNRFNSLGFIPASYNVFRPIYNDYDASLLLDLASDLDYIDFDMIEIKEFTSPKGKIKYRGWLTKGGENVPRSLIKTSPSIPILKCSILAALIMDESEHETYMHALYEYLYGPNWMNYQKKDEDTKNEEEK